MTQPKRKPAGPDGTIFPRSSGLKVIILGFGFAGAVAAIECHRKGHDVVVYEQADVLTTAGKTASKPPLGIYTDTVSGDLIGLTTNAAQVLSKWNKGKFNDEVNLLCADFVTNTIHKHTGEEIFTQPMDGYSIGSGYVAPRGPMALLFAKHARELGIPVHLGHRVLEYFETGEEAGIVVNGQRVVADAVLCCDGVHSKARPFVIGVDEKPYPTGYAVYRAWYSADLAKGNPDLDFMFAGEHDAALTFIGPDMHCLISTCSHKQGICWAFTHKDDYNISESWTFPGTIKDALEYAKGWDSRIHAVIKATPEDQIIDHKLLWRNALPTWISKHGRMMILGDAAHPFLPTSGQGASQAIEDAATIAICLELAGKDEVPLALRVCEKLRYVGWSIYVANG